MVEEFQALQSTGTWSLVPSSPTQNLVGCKWVFRVKRKPDGTVDRYKAHLVTKGFHQQERIDFTEIFSPIAKPVTIRILLTLAEEVFMQQPPGFIDPSKASYICKLHKSLYGLKQAPRAWYDKLFQTLVSLGFTNSTSDCSLFVHYQPALVIVLVYVDDIIVTGPNAQLCQAFIHKLGQLLPVKDLGPLHYFLGLEVHRSSAGIFLSQHKYDADLLLKTKMHDSNQCVTPLGTQKLDHSGTITDGLWFKKSCLHLTAFSDADWAGFVFDRRSTSGYCVYIGSNLISWSAKKQHTIARSSTEDEYRSLAHTSAEITWICKIFNDIAFPLSKVPVLWCDNISAISLASNPVFHARTKHMKIDYHYIRELVLAS
ncbi:unnamed protein product [Malus baccata var. baccata]